MLSLIIFLTGVHTHILALKCAVICSTYTITMTGCDYNPVFYLKGKETIYNNPDKFYKLPKSCHQFRQPYFEGPTFYNRIILLQWGKEMGRNRTYSSIFFRWWLGLWHRECTQRWRVLTYIDKILMWVLHYILSKKRKSALIKICFYIPSCKTLF